MKSIGWIALTCIFDLLFWVYYSCILKNAALEYSFLPWCTYSSCSYFTMYALWVCNDFHQYRLRNWLLCYVCNLQSVIFVDLLRKISLSIAKLISLYPSLFHCRPSGCYLYRWCWGRCCCYCYRSVWDIVIIIPWQNNLEMVSFTTTNYWLVITFKWMDQYESVF